MEELGAESEMFHRALGRTLRLRAEDFLCVIGDQANAVRVGVLENGSRDEQIGVAKNVEEITPRVASWRGAVFVKGSRRYALERVVETNAVAAH
jgi:UDP-N-acetylmuramyl pentapeptide synthase